MNIINHSIRLKLIVIVAIAVLVSIVIATIASTWRETTRYSQAKRSELEGTALAFSAGIAEPLANKNKTNVQKTLRAIGRIPGISYIQIKDETGRKFAEMGSAVVIRHSLESQTTKKDLSPLDLLLGSNLEIQTNIINGGKIVGQMSLLADTSDLRDRLISGFGDALISAFLAMLLGIALTARLHRVITGPIQQLTAAMVSVRTTHNFSHHVEKSTEDETGIMVDTFNDMLDQINVRDKRLIEHQDQLETTVEERTHDLKQAKNAAENANAAKSDFLATMSHEIRTPMNGMLVMSELLATAELSHRHRRYAEVIMRSGQSLLSIINDILDFSKIEAGHLELEKIPVDPSILIDDVLSLFWERATSKNLDIAAFIAPQVPRLIEGDPVRINQVLSNLVNNALKFTESGCVFVTVDIAPDAPTTSDGFNLRISVSDTGIGIAEDKISSVFESFSQADQSTTRQYGGTGLGLAICKRLVSAMQGEIKLESQLGKGSTFSFTIETKALGPSVDLSAPQESKLNSTAIILKDLGSKIALQSYLAGVNVAATVIEAANFSSDQIIDNKVIFADAEIIQQINPQGHQVRSNDQPIFVCVSKLGDSLSERLIRSNQANDLLMLPIARNSVCDLIQRLIAEQPLGLAAIEHKMAPQEEMPSFEGLRVLVADDSPINREVIIEALNRLKVNVHTVENGQEAVQAVKSHDYDLVFMDCSMPVMDGFTATRKIRETEQLQNPSKHLPIVALTAHVAGGPANEWQNSGMDDCISKPFKIQTLVKCFETFTPTDNLQKQNVSEAPEIAVVTDAAEDDMSVIDMDTLEGIKEINPQEATEIFMNIFGLYESHAPEAVSKLKETLENNEPLTIAAAAHALKSLSTTIGASRVSRACEKLEKQARNNKLSNSARQVGEIEVELGEALNAISDLKTNNFKLKV